MPFPSPTPPAKQRIAVAVLVALGILGAMAIWRLGPTQPAGEEGHGHAAAQGHAEHDDDDHADKAHGQGHPDDHRNDRPTDPHDQHPEHGQDEAGLIAMSDAQIQSASIVVEAARDARIQSTLTFPGEIRFNEDRTAHVVPRVAGVVDQVAVSLGERVQKGQVLATLSSATVSEQRSELQAALKREQLARSTYEREKRLWQDKISPEQDVLAAEAALREAEIAVANRHQKLQAIGALGQPTDSLNRFQLRAPFNGTVVEKHLTLGELVKEDANVFTIADLDTVWAEIDVAAKDIGQFRVGDKVSVRSGASAQTVTGTVAYIGALLGEQTRAAKARITLANPQGAWRPGLFVTVERVAEGEPAAVTVSADAVQQVDNRATVFVRVPEGFAPQPVVLGRSDGQRVEVLRGLQPGTLHAAAGSFLIKSEAGKGSATHTH
ncbi:efflux RND transporter periplasmic adaptor subunit [Ideonella sp. DXS29W]|uniref:Efflux RND transporter periplasmic adaptor subunit n=1 Tax=Ideonella lacteola TaxID=2984193 RepID=A0ABU9BXJ2_9BURK